MKKILVALLVFGLFFNTFSSVFAHPGDLDKNGCHFEYYHYEGQLYIENYHCHRKFIAPIFKLPTYGVFNLNISNKFKDNYTIKEEVKRYIKEKNTCNGILTELGNFAQNINLKDKFYFTKEYKRQLMQDYYKYLELGDITKTPFETLGIKLTELETDYILKKNNYEGYKVDWSKLVADVESEIGSASASAIQDSIYFLRNELINGYYDEFKNYHLYTDELKELSLEYQKLLYTTHDLLKKYKDFDTLIINTCKTQFLEIKQQEIKKIDGQIQKQKDKIKKEKEQMKKYVEEKQKISIRLQEKFNHIDKILSKLYKKYPKKILSLLPTINKMKYKFKKDSEKYLILDYLENKINNIKD